MQSLKKEIKLSHGEEITLLTTLEKGYLEIDSGSVRRIAHSLMRKGLTKIVQIYDGGKDRMVDVIDLTEEGRKIAIKLKLSKEIARAYDIANSILHQQDLNEKKVDEVLKEIKKLIEMTENIDDLNERKKAIRVIYVLARRTLPRIRIR